MIEDDSKVKKSKIAPGTIKIMMAGDLLLARNPDRANSGIFRRYEAVLEKLANMEREERILNYKFLIGLMLTSHAKKAHDLVTRKAIFDLKNGLFLNVANNRHSRRKLAFRYLISKNFRVSQFCAQCEEENKKTETPKHQWKFCKDCEVDRKFYNVLSMHHKFEAGSATLFLSNDLVHKVDGLRVPQRSKIEDFKEEAQFEKYHYHVRNLDVFDIENIKLVQSRLLEIF